MHQQIVATPAPTGYENGFSTVQGEQDPITVCIPDPNGGNPLIYALPPGTSMMLAGQGTAAAMGLQPQAQMALPQPGVYQPAPQPQANGYPLHRPGFPLQSVSYGYRADFPPRNFPR